MSVGKFLFIITLITAVALGYVYQQMELLKINYTLQRNRGNLLVLLDQNSALMYNVDCLQSPLYLEQRLNGQKEVNWEIPSPWYKIGLAEAAK
ncbi:hypothetical protein ACFL1I_04150 [Candidatus Omnitrophota bacterium]